MAYTLPELNYSYDALEPYIDARTMEIHHSKHHGGYVTKVNAALESHADWRDKKIDEVIKSLSSLPESVRTAVRNNGGGHFNHTIFWSTMGPGKGGDASAELGEAINSEFGSFAQFKDAFSTAAANRFGSGWAWLVLNSSGKLSVVSTPNQDNPISEGQQPILGLDVWEHAYYLKYQNRRPEYIENWWNVVDWDAVNQRYLAAR